jgi:hypothetical protein
MKKKMNGLLKWIVEKIEKQKYMLFSFKKIQVTNAKKVTVSVLY